VTDDLQATPTIWQCPGCGRGYPDPSRDALLAEIAGLSARNSQLEAAVEQAFIRGRDVGREEESGLHY
jgi:hypothetical protein